MSRANDQLEPCKRPVRAVQTLRLDGSNCMDRRLIPLLSVNCNLYYAVKPVLENVVCFFYFVKREAVGD